MQSMTVSKANKEKTAYILKCLVIVGILALFILMAIYIGGILRELFGSIFAAVALAYIILPVQKKFEKRFSRGISAIVSVVLFFGFFILMAVLLLPALLEELNELSARIPDVVNYLQEILSGIQNKIQAWGISFSIDKVFSDNVGSISAFATDFAKKIVEFLIKLAGKLPVIVLVPVFMFYFLKDRVFFQKNFAFIIPAKYLKTVSDMLSGAGRIVKCYLRTQLVVAVIVGILTVVGYFIVGVPYALVLGLFMGVCEIIPYFGPVIGAIPACIIVLIENPNIIIATVIAVVVVQQLEGNFISPYLMGAHFDINPVTVIVILFLFGNVFGFFGLIIAIPVYAVLRDITRTFFNKTVKAG